MSDDDYNMSAGWSTPDRGVRAAVRPPTDQLLLDIAEYMLNYPAKRGEARDAAFHCLLDSLACALMALRFPACTKLLGPVVPGAGMRGGARVPGTNYQLDPVTAAFNIGALVRWLDFNDTWLAAEWGHPSDNIAAILAVADYLSRKNSAAGQAPLTGADVLEAMIKAHEIQGVLALKNSFNRFQLDHVLLVRIASTAVATRMLGGKREHIVNALSNAWLDGGALRAYRHAPNTGTRKSWAAGDAASRAVRLSLLAMTGEMGYPSALSADHWGFQDALMGGNEITLEQPFGCYVMENVLFKISYPAEFHAQTAVEAAMTLHGKVKNRLNDVEKVVVETQDAAMRIIDKTGPLDNPADRDHCLQYMTAVPLIFGRLTAEDYEDEVAFDPRIDTLRSKMEVQENPGFSQTYHDPEQRAISNAVQVFFRNGTCTDRIAVHYPIGHRRRRAEGIPLLLEKFKKAVENHFPAGARRDAILVSCGSRATLEAIPVHMFMDLWRKEHKQQA